MADYANPYLGGNPQLQGVIDSAQGDLVRNFNLTAQPAFNSGMVKSGSFGNAGVDEMNSNAQRNLQQSLGDVSSKLRFNDFQQQQNMYRWDQEMGRNVYNDSFAQNQQNLQTGIGLLGTMNQWNQQNLQNGTSVQNTPLNYYNQFQNIANGIGNGFGTATETKGTTSNPVATVLGGAQLGKSLAGAWSSGGSGGGSNGGWDWGGLSADGRNSATGQYWA